MKQHWVCMNCRMETCRSCFRSQDVLQHSGISYRSKGTFDIFVCADCAQKFGFPGVPDEHCLAASQCAEIMGTEAGFCEEWTCDQTGVNVNKYIVGATGHRQFNAGKCVLKPNCTCAPDLPLCAGRIYKRWRMRVCRVQFHGPVSYFPGLLPCSELSGL